MDAAANQRKKIKDLKRDDQLQGNEEDLQVDEPLP